MRASAVAGGLSAKSRVVSPSSLTKTNDRVPEKTFVDDNAFIAEGLLLPQPPGKDYRLLKIVTQPATPSQIEKLGNDRAPIVRQFLSQDFDTPK